MDPVDLCTHRIICTIFDFYSRIPVIFLCKWKIQKNPRWI